MLPQLHQRALVCESRSKETAKTIHHNVHIVECKKVRLKGIQFFTLAQLHQRALAYES
jgi:hypothetical protein